MLGQTIAARRRSLGLSVSKAAQLAEVSRQTWTVWERGDNTPDDYNRIRIERALCWALGSVDAILAGGEPAPAEQHQSRVSEEARRQILAAPSSELAKLLMVLWDKFGDEAFYPALVEVLAIRRGEMLPAPNQVSGTSERDRSRSPERVE